MSARLIYVADFSGAVRVQRAVWMMLAVTFLVVLLFVAYVQGRQARIEELQALVLSQQLLPEEGQRFVPDTQLQRQREEVLGVSREISLPVQQWLNCLQLGQNSTVKIDGLDWNTAAGWIELRMVAGTRDEAARYLGMWQVPDSKCSVMVRQEERSPDGASLLSLRIRPIGEGQ